MTQERKNELKKLAKGHWQAEILSDLLTGREIINPISCLKGAAKRYSLRYKESFNNLLWRIKQVEGIEIEVKYGPRGGLWGATYKIIF